MIIILLKEAVGSFSSLLFVYWVPQNINGYFLRVVLSTWFFLIASCVIFVVSSDLLQSRAWRVFLSRLLEPFSLAHLHYHRLQIWILMRFCQCRWNRDLSDWKMTPVMECYMDCVRCPEDNKITSFTSIS